MSLPAASRASMTRTAAGRQAAQVAAARQRAHEHAVVVERRRHADAVAEDGAARHRARGVDGDDADGLALRAQVLRVGVDERRLAGARRTREADDEGVPQVRLHGLQQARARSADSRSSSVTAREMARRSPARMRAIRRARSARSSACGGFLGVRHGEPDTGPRLRAQWRAGPCPRRRDRKPPLPSQPAPAAPLDGREPGSRSCMKTARRRERGSIAHLQGSRGGVERSGLFVPPRRGFSRCRRVSPCGEIGAFEERGGGQDDCGLGAHDESLWVRMFLSPRSGGDAARPMATIAQVASISEQEAHAIGVNAYLYFYSLVTMDLTRKQMTNVPAGKELGFGPPNTFKNIPAYPAAADRVVVRPNFDTLYSCAWLDLTKEPVIVSVPDTGGRYYLLPMLDMWTDVFASPGWRTTGNAGSGLPGRSAGMAARPERQVHRGVPAAEGIFSASMLRRRTSGSSAAQRRTVRPDYAAVNKIQAGLKITPLSEWGRSPRAGRDQDRSGYRHEDLAKGAGRYHAGRTSSSPTRPSS